MKLSIKENREKLEISIINEESGYCYAFVLCENGEHYKDELNNAKQVIKKKEKEIAPLEAQVGILLRNWR